MKPTLRSVGRVLHEAHHVSGTVAYRYTQATFWVLIVVAALVLLVELIGSPVPDSFLLVLGTIDRCILFFFCVELVLRVITFHPPELEILHGSPAWRIRKHIIGRLWYAINPVTLLDLVTIIGFMPALRGLRALRMVWLVVGITMFPRSNPLFVVFRVFWESWILYLSALGVLLVVIVIGGLSLFLIEFQTNPALERPIDGIWWGLVTITTVGFGDVTPVTTAGRLVASGVMIVGVFAMAIFAGIVTTTLLTVVIRLQSEHFRMSGQANHIIICGYESGSRQLLDTIMDEHSGRQHRELLLFGPGSRPADIPTAFTWVDGDPTRENQLPKVRPEHADTIIVVGRRSMTPQEADATTILTIFTLRRHLSSRPRPRKYPLYIIAEVLENENLDHVRAAGADEVIETTRLGFAMVAHSVVAPGSGEVMSQVASASAASIYVGNPSLTEPELYGSVVKRMHEELSISVLGIANPSSGAPTLAPLSGVSVHPGDALIYLATSARLPMIANEEISQLTASLSEITAIPLDET